jgi:CBS domain-containing protein
MTSPAVTAPASSTVRSVAGVMLEHGLGAVPIVDDAGAPVGVASDGDLLGRRSGDTLRDWWLSLLADGLTQKWPFDEKVNRNVGEVMSVPVIVASPDTRVQEVAELLQTHRIKRVPVVKDGRVVGVVSRSDLLPLVGRMPAAEAGESRGGLVAFLESLVGGASLRGTLDPASEAPAATASGPAAFTASALRADVQAFESEEVRERQDARRESTVERRREIKMLLDQHVNEALWRDLLHQARLAARAGEKELQMLRFPSDLCSDGGREIDMAEPGWEDTLRGEAAEVYDRWKKELRPNGFGLSARVVSYVDGVLGDIGLFLNWGI